MSQLLPKEKHEHEMLKFPEGFLWGTATSAHQVEGNNINSDWWEWEKGKIEDLRSGIGANQYELFQEDFKLLKDLSQNAHRLSIEWARIEPKEGIFDIGEIAHYTKMLKKLKSLNVKVFLTLWHFTLPKWVADRGGWENPKTADFFERFIKTIIPELKDYVDFWITLNEPGVYVYMSYLKGVWPPQKKSKWKTIRAFFNLASAHKKAYALIHKLIPGAKVGLANNIQSFLETHKHSLIELLSIFFSDIINNHSFYYLTSGFHDFLGINYYFHHRVQKAAENPIEDESHEVSDLGWEIYPEGIFDVLMDLKNHLPIYITECGIASTNDDRRTRFLIHYIQEIYRAIQSGVNIKGFFYWSLIDNFEWDKGFAARFGLIEINYENQKRTIRPSAYVYSEIIKQNGIPHELLKLLGHRIRVDEVLNIQRN